MNEYFINNENYKTLYQHLEGITFRRPVENGQRIKFFTRKYENMLKKQMDNSFDVFFKKLNKKKEED